MKRNNKGVPISMVNRWSRPPLSCRPCREKKRRCDRNHPCSNCTLRSIPCHYASHGIADKVIEDNEVQQVPFSISCPSPAAVVNQPALLTENVLYRIRRLEEAVFHNEIQTDPSTSKTWAGPGHDASDKESNPFGFHLPSDSLNKSSVDMAFVARCLPPIETARELFDHFALISQLTFGILHVPSRRALMEQTYHSILKDEEPDPSTLLLLLTIFAGGAFLWTPELLQRLRSSQGEAKAASSAYTRLALSMLDDTHQTVSQSTTALEAIYNLAYLSFNSIEFGGLSQMLRVRCILMARQMGIHRLDTDKSRHDRRLKGCNMGDVELQRRIWWSMVASDWLAAFAGGPQEGAYMLQPKHMNVHYPSNVDDEFIIPEMVEHDFPLSTLTNTMSAFIQRLKIADLCREVVDALPSILHESQEPEYAVILALDKKFHEYLEQLPVFFRLDATSIQQSHEAYRKRPNLTLQRIGIHFTLESRRCRLHRPYYLEGSTNPKYAFSRTICIRSAQKVLELRRSMDDVCEGGTYLPARSWIVMEHVFLAALILATDVAFNPNAPDAEAQKAKVLAAYQTLERSKEDSKPLMRGLQRNMQTLMSTLQSPQIQIQGSGFEVIADEGNGPSAAPDEIVSNGISSSKNRGFYIIEAGNVAVDSQAPFVEDVFMIGDKRQSNGLPNGKEIEEDHWNRLWSEFLDVSLQLEAPQWSSLLDDLDLSFPPDI